MYDSHCLLRAALGLELVKALHSADKQHDVEEEGAVVKKDRSRVKRRTVQAKDREKCSDSASWDQEMDREIYPGSLPWERGKDLEGHADNAWVVQEKKRERFADGDKAQGVPGKERGSSMDPGMEQEMRHGTWVAELTKQSVVACIPLVKRACVEEQASTLGTETEQGNGPCTCSEVRATRYGTWPMGQESGRETWPMVQEIERDTWPKVRENERDTWQKELESGLWPSV